MCIRDSISCDAQGSVALNENSKYYVKGIRLSGRDNNTVCLLYTSYNDSKPKFNVSNAVSLEGVDNSKTDINTQLEYTKSYSCLLYTSQPHVQDLPGCYRGC